MKANVCSFLALAISAFPSEGFVSSGVSRDSFFRAGRASATFAPATLLGISTADTKSTNSESSKNAVEPDSDYVTAEETERRLSLLNQAIRSFNSSAARELVDELSQMRRNATNQLSIETVLNDLLAKGPDSALPVWSKPRWFTRFSKRARLASLRRTLDLTTPPSGAEDDEEDTVEDQMRRRRRALVALLRQFGDYDTEDCAGTAVAYLEQKARREKKSVNKDDLIKRRPEGLDTPKYEVLVAYPSSGFEIRRYEPFSVCSVSTTKARPVDSYKTDASVFDAERRSARAFGALAGYLFGKNQQKQAMAMTTPVLTQGGVGDKDKVMSFVLPPDYWKEGSLERAPKPIAGSGVTLEQKKGEERAVVMFGGYSTKKTTEEREKELLDTLAKDKKWEAVDNASVTLSQYNDPFTPPWKRVNEVSIPVRLVHNG